MESCAYIGPSAQRARSHKCPLDSTSTVFDQSLIHCIFVMLNTLQWYAVGPDYVPYREGVKSNIIAFFLGQYITWKAVFYLLTFINIENNSTQSQDPFIRSSFILSVHLADAPGMHIPLPCQQHKIVTSGTRPYFPICTRRCTMILASAETSADRTFKWLTRGRKVIRHAQRQALRGATASTQDHFWPMSITIPRIIALIKALTKLNLQGGTSKIVHCLDICRGRAAKC